MGRHASTYLATDGPNRDRYDRQLRYVWLDYGDGEVYLVNEALARSGYAALSTYLADVAYVEEIREAQRFARAHGYGLWSGCQTDAAGDTNELSGTLGVGTGSEPLPELAIPIALPAAAGAAGCDASYPGVGTALSPSDLDCGDVSHRRFAVMSPDPHRFDGDFDGIGCEQH